MSVNYLIQKTLGTVVSDTWQPFKPVEAARWLDWDYAGSAWVGDNDGVATGTITETASTKDDGTYTVNTTGGNGFNCQITYTVASNVASSLVIAQAGGGYAVSDVLTAEGDTVEVTVNTLTDP